MTSQSRTPDSSVAPVERDPLCLTLRSIRSGLLQPLRKLLLNLWISGGQLLKLLFLALYSCTLIIAAWTVRCSHVLPCRLGVTLATVGSHCHSAPGLPRSGVAPAIEFKLRQQETVKTKHSPSRPSPPPSARAQLFRLLLKSPGSHGWIQCCYWHGTRDDSLGHFDLTFVMSTSFEVINPRFR
jgi:hypothetical protein